MPRNRKVTVVEIMEAASDSPAAALGILRKHLKSGIGERYESRSNYLSVILDRNERNLDAIRRTEDMLWKSTGRALLMLAAVTAAVQLTRSLATGYVYKTALGTAAAVGVVAVFLAAWRTLRNLESDLQLYRETAKLNDEMLNMTVGIDALAGKVISARREAMGGRRDMMYLAGENRLHFVRWTRQTMAACAIAACAVCELLVWAGATV